MLDICVALNMTSTISKPFLNCQTLKQFHHSLKVPFRCSLNVVVLDKALQALVMVLAPIILLPGPDLAPYNK